MGIGLARMMLRGRPAWVFAALAGAGCAQVPAPPAPPPAACGTVPTLYDVQRAITDYIDSGRYEADVASVTGEAQRWLERRAADVPKPAIVLDVDETSLSNWPAYRVNGWVRVLRGDCDLETGPCNVRKWQEMGQSPAVAPTLELARRAADLGVKVFFLTGRPESLREPTERNLRRQGYAFERLLLRPPGIYPSAADFKARQRCELERAGYAIVLAMGDQQSDLDGGCAERGFKLPNPVYFLP